MMDGRDQSWRFSYDESSADNSDEKPQPQPSVGGTAGRRLSDLLHKDETAIARRMDAIDAAVENLHEFAGQPTRPKAPSTLGASTDQEHARKTQPERAGSTNILRPDAAARELPVKVEPAARPGEAPPPARQEVLPASKAEVQRDVRASDIGMRQAPPTAPERREQALTSAGVAASGKPAQRGEAALTSPARVAESSNGLSNRANAWAFGQGLTGIPLRPAGDADSRKPAETSVASPFSQRTAADLTGRSAIAMPATPTRQSQSDPTEARSQRTPPVVTPQKPNEDMRADARPSKQAVVQPFSPDGVEETASGGDPAQQARRN